MPKKKKASAGAEVDKNKLETPAPAEEQPKTNRETEINQGAVSESLVAEPEYYEDFKIQVCPKCKAPKNIESQRANSMPKKF